MHLFGSSPSFRKKTAAVFQRLILCLLLSLLTVAQAMSNGPHMAERVDAEGNLVERSFDAQRSALSWAVSIHPEDSLALVDLYYSLQGDDWVNNSGWLTEYVEFWVGVDRIENVKTDQDPEWRVTRLRFPSGNMTVPGTIISDLGNRMSYLKRFSIQDNLLSGTLPSSLSWLKNLEVLQINGNPELQGPIPIEFTGLANLSRFWYYGTGLCEPDSRSFRNWQNGIDDLRGSYVCGQDPKIVLTSPKDGEQALELPYRFQWERDYSVEQYLLQISVDDVFASPVHEVSLEEHEVKLHRELEPATTYFWRVGAISNGFDLWSDIWSFRTADERPFAGGSGTEEDPYQVATLEQLQGIGDSLYLDKHFILVNDIDASETSDWNDGKGFDPIGTPKLPFTGVFHGSGHVISNLFIHREEEDHVGLFGYASSEGHTNRAVIKMVGLEIVTVTGRDNVGGLVGKHKVFIMHTPVMLNLLNEVYVTGRVTGNDRTGGLAGQLEYVCLDYHQSFRLRAFTKVDVSGRHETGGIAGFLGTGEDVIGIQVPCYVSEVWAAGSVDGDERTGALLGTNFKRLLSKSYWDVEKSGQQFGIGDGFSEIVGVKGLTTDQMTDQNAYIHMNELDFDQTWQLTEGYPVLRWQEPDDAVDAPEVPIVRIAPKEEKYDYGEVESDSSATRSYTLRNTGNVMMSGNVSLTDAHDGVFEIIRGKGDYTLDPDSSRVVEIEFIPASADTFQTILEIHHDAPNRDDPLEVTLKGKGKLPTFVNEPVRLPRQIELHQNYPNPFNPSTQIRFALPEMAHVHLAVYNILGQEVSTLVNETRPAGWHNVIFDASGLSSSVFIYRLEAGDYVETKSMLFLK